MLEHHHRQGAAAARIAEQRVDGQDLSSRLHAGNQAAAAQLRQLLVESGVMQAIAGQIEDRALLAQRGQGQGERLIDMRICPR